MGDNDESGTGVDRKKNAAKNDAAERAAAQSNRRLIARLSTSYLVVLIAGFAVYTFSEWFRGEVPDRLGLLPIGVPFFGALGATLISLVGVTEHREDWDLGYRYWHYTRPLVGAVVGSVGCLIVLVLVRAADKSATAPETITFNVVAFVLGYREEAFRDLVKKLVDTILIPGEGKADTPADGKTSPSGNDKP